MENIYYQIFSKKIYLCRLQSRDSERNGIIEWRLIQHRHRQRNDVIEDAFIGY